MKYKLHMRTPAAILLLIASIATTAAQTAPGSPPAVATPHTVWALGPHWIAPNWPDPGIILTNVIFNDLTLREVVAELRQDFKRQLHILPIPQTFEHDWGDTRIQMRLENVKAREVFSVMNSSFERNQTPLRWELTVDANNYPVAQLRVLSEQIPPVEKIRRVYFIGNLLADEKLSGMTINQINDTIRNIWPIPNGHPESILWFNQSAQLLIVYGTPEQQDYIEQTLKALRQKVDWERSNKKSTDASTKADDTKSNLKPDNGSTK